MKGENLNCKVLSVMTRHLISFNCFSFGNKSLNLNDSRLAGTLLTVAPETF